MRGPRERGARATVGAQRAAREEKIGARLNGRSEISSAHLAENPQHANCPEGRDQAGRLIGDEGGGDGGRHHRHVEGAPGAGPDPAGVKRVSTAGFTSSDS